MNRWALCLILVFGLLSCSDQVKTQADLENIPIEASAATLFEINQTMQDNITALRKTARAVSVMNEHDKARAAFKNILDAVKTNYPKDSYPVAMALNDYGFILNVIGATRDALPVQQRAVDIIRALPSDTPYAKDRRWRMIANLAETELRLGNIERARKLYAEAYKIPITLPWALPEDTTSGARTLVIIERWRQRYKTDPKTMFAETDYTADPVYQAEVFANQDKGRYMDFGANPAESVRVWKNISVTMAEAYHVRSRLATSALGNYGAISYFSDAKELGLEATLAALKQKEKFGTEFWFDAQNLSRAQAAAASTLINMNRAAEAGPYVEGLRKTLLQTMKGDTIDMSLLHTLERDRAMALGDYALAIDATKKMIALNIANPQKMDDQSEAQVLGLAQLYLSAGDTVAAEQSARAAMATELADGKDKSRRLSEAQYIIGQSLILQGRTFEADTMLRRAVKTQKLALGKDLTHTGPFLMALASNLSAQGKFEAAVAMSKQGTDILIKTRGETSQVTSAGLIKAAGISLAAKQFQNAVLFADQAILALQENAERTDAFEAANMIKAQALEGLGKPQAAATIIKAVLAAKQAAGMEGSLSFWRAKLLQLSIGGSSQARLRQAWPLLEKFAQDNVRARAASEGAARDPLVSRLAFEKFLGMAVQAGDHEKTLEAAQYLIQTSAARTSEFAARRRALGDPILADLIKSEQSLRRRLSVLNLSYARMVNVDNDRAKVILQEIERETSQLQQVQKQRNSTYPNMVFTQKFDTNIKLKTLRRQLEKGEAVLVLAEGRDALYPIVITKDGMVASKSGLAAPDVQNIVSDLHRALSTGQNFNIQKSNQLYRAIFTPEIKALLGDTTHINVVANGSLSSLPMAVLSQSPNMPDWLIHTYSFTTLASLGSLQEKTRRGSNANGFLGIGAPLGNAADLPALPFAKRELEQLSKSLSTENAKLLIGENATHENLDALDLRRFRTVVFATHGLVSGEVHGLVEPALVLSPLGDDGLLTASEISDMEFDADWIILSACNSATGGNSGAPGLTGLARAFINAGARSLLVSHWNVRDDASAYLTLNTINNSEHRMDKAQALQAAMLGLMKNPDIKNAAHPSIWGPFVLVGN